jgi:hypothetical protein
MPLTARSAPSMSHLSHALRHACSKCARTRLQRSVWSVNGAPCHLPTRKLSKLPPVLESVLILLPKDARQKCHSKPIARGIERAAPAAHF